VNRPELLLWARLSQAAAGAARDYVHFAHGIIGAVMAVWMVAIVVIARGPFVAGERHAWIAIAWPLGFWFPIDGGSLSGQRCPEPACSRRSRIFKAAPRSPRAAMALKRVSASKLAKA
jgi:hypothetical protein